MSEIITLNLGQPGVQAGSAITSLLRKHYKLSAQGKRTEDEHDSPHRMFQQHPLGFSSRAHFIDFDPDTLNTLYSAHQPLINPNNLLSAREESSGLYSVAESISKRTPQIIDRIRINAEKCDSLEAFHFFHSLSGGIGTGCYSDLSAALSVDYPKKQKISYTLNPSKNHSNNIVDAYNAILCSPALGQYCNLSIMVDNESLYRYTERHLNDCCPSYSDINGLWGSIYDSLHVMNSQTITSNLVAYPRVHYVYPAVSFGRNVSTLTQSNLEGNSNRLLETGVDRSNIAILMKYTGDITPREVNLAMRGVSPKFVEWVPTGFKIHIHSRSVTLSSREKQAPPPPLLQPPLSESKSQGSPTELLNELRPSHFLYKMLYGVKRREKEAEADNGLDGLLKGNSLVSLTSSHEFQEVFRRINLKFDKLYSRRAFVHWYLRDGYEEGCFSESREDLAALEKDYQEWGGYTSYQQEDSDSHH